jgi:Transglycosylase SLT domain
MHCLHLSEDCPPHSLSPSVTNRSRATLGPDSPPGPRTPDRQPANGSLPERWKGCYVAGHRSPRGARAPRTAGSTGTGRHHAAHRPTPTGPSLGTTVIATTAAVGAVATGAFTAIIPTVEDGTATAAAADSPYDAALASSSTALDAVAPAVSMVPVELAADADSVEEHVARVVQAADLAKLHAEQAEQQRIADLIDRGGLDGWIAEALQILELPQSLAPGVKRIVLKESNGNPRAINNWDANARRGTPSQGLMQTIPTTYKHYVHPDLKNRPITDPVANITAGIRYMIDNYGMSTVKAGGRSNSAGNYVGY